MSGKRQHYIPQFLQNGFASHVVGDEVFTWVYRKGAKAFNTNIKNSGVENYFYSENNNSELDDTITKAEYAFSQLVNKLRKENQVESSDYEYVKQLFAHLEIRTRHIRQSFLKTGNNLLNELMTFLDNPASCEKFFRQQVLNNPTLIKDSFSNELYKQGLSQEWLPMLMELSGPLIEQIMPSLSNDMVKMIAYIKKELPEVLKKESKSGHIKALTKSIAPDIKIQRYERLNFKVKKSEEANLLLGDSAILFHVDGNRKFKPFLENNDVLVSILLPISSTQALVGSKKGYKLDFSVLPHAIASSSREYFIASNTCPENEGLSHLISKNAHLLTKSQSEKLLNEIIKKKDQGQT